MRPLRRIHIGPDDVSHVIAVRSRFALTEKKVGCVEQFPLADSAERYPITSSTVTEAIPEPFSKSTLPRRLI